MNERKARSIVLYTTLYRLGGPKFQLAAEKKVRDLVNMGKNTLHRAVESKKDFLKVMDEVSAQGLWIDELHFFGHSGMYGIMFGTVQWPEQFSPFEWKNMTLPVRAESKLYFHACRSGRWFAPFIARALNVNAFGYHNYTTVSLSPKRFVWEGWNAKSKDLFIIACAGKKSHGYLASIFKYLSLTKADVMAEYTPHQVGVDGSYDDVANLYESTFEDIVVRSDELTWLEKKLAGLHPKAVLDIGCGNGAFLDRLSSHFEKGSGVDLSEGMLNQAQNRCVNNPKLNFKKIDGPQLPFPDNSFDVVMSTLSFRYLDWDPIMMEILRVLKSGGHFLVLDMVTAPLSLKEMGAFATSKLRLQLQRVRCRSYYQALRKMVTSKAWRQMLKNNPIRSEHEMRWYLESRFQGQKAEVINVGFRSRILAFDSGRIHTKHIEKMSYP